VSLYSIVTGNDPRVFGAACGGGRICITSGSNENLNILSNLLDNNINYQGGNVEYEFQSYCLLGATGTFFLQTIYNNNDDDGDGDDENNNIGNLLINSKNSKSLAGTFIEKFPSNMFLINATEKSKLLISSSFTSAHCTLLLDYSLLFLFSNTSSTSINIKFGQILIQNSSILSYNDNVTSPTLNCDTLHINPTSVILFPYNLEIIPTIEVVSYGKITQTSANPNGQLSINGNTNGNITLSFVNVENLYVSGDNIFIDNNGYIFPTNSSFVTCFDNNVPQNNFQCDNEVNMESIGFNNRIILVANKAIYIHSGASLTSSTMFICSPILDVQFNSTLSTNGRGCKPNTGIGAGAKSTISGGGGGGSSEAGGNGGSSENGVPTDGGRAYMTSTYWSTGSGGGSSAIDIVDLEGSGGGTIFINIANYMILDGTITSTGNIGTESKTENEGGGGGGGGGLIVLSTQKLSGSGLISVAGGDGNSGTFAGGGGGAGLLEIIDKNSVIDETSKIAHFSYSGQIDSNGGDKGKQTSLSQSSIAPTSGNKSEILLPVCGAGYGNHWEDCDEGSSNICNLQICSLCPCKLNQSCDVGFGSSADVECKSLTCQYNNGGNSDFCKSCDSPELHLINNQIYKDNNIEGLVCSEKNGGCNECPAQCVNITPCQTKNKCYSYIACFLKTYIIYVIPLLFLAVILVFIFLFYRIKIYIWISNLKNKLFYGENKSIDTINYFERENNIGVKDDKKIELSVIKNPIYLQENINEVTSEEKIRQRKKLITESLFFKDRQLGMKLNEDDLPFHACRVYLMGANHPFSSRGGQWKLSRSRPICLRPMLLPDKYEDFANHINDIVSWDLHW
jgi:hypothetical protein